MKILRVSEDALASGRIKVAYVASFSMLPWILGCLQDPSKGYTVVVEMYVCMGAGVLNGSLPGTDVVSGWAVHLALRIGCLLQCVLTDQHTDRPFQKLKDSLFAEWVYVHAHMRRPSAPATTNFL